VNARLLSVLALSAPCGDERAGGRRPLPHIRIFNAFPVGFIYFQLMDGAEAPYEHQHGATDESRTADF
jgi:hypothetical protein